MKSIIIKFMHCHSKCRLIFIYNQQSKHTKYNGIQWNIDNRALLLCCLFACWNQRKRTKQKQKQKMIENQLLTITSVKFLLFRIVRDMNQQQHHQHNYDRCNVAFDFLQFLFSHAPVVRGIQLHGILLGWIISCRKTGIYIYVLVIVPSCTRLNMV